MTRSFQSGELQYEIYKVRHVAVPTVSYKKKKSEWLPKFRITSIRRVTEGFHAGTNLSV